MIENLRPMMMLMNLKLNFSIFSYFLKLVIYILEYGNKLLEEKNMDRRAYKRNRIQSEAVIQLLDASGTPLNKGFYGSLSDIGIGGLSLFVKIYKKQIVH